MLKIHGHPNSINVRKLLWLCAELELSYEREDWGGYGQFRSLNEPAYPQVAAYYDRLSERPGYRAYGRNGVPKFRKSP